MGKPKAMITTLYYLKIYKDKLKDLITFNHITKVFKHKTIEYPSHVLSLPTVDYITDSATRQRNNLNVPRTSTDTGARSLHALGPKLWNQPPKEIKDSRTLTTLQSNIKKKLLAFV